MNAFPTQLLVARGPPRRARLDQSGQSMTEFIIIVALVAIAALAAVTLLGDYDRKIFGTSTNALANEADSTGAQARIKVFGHRDLSNFAVYGSNNPYSGPGNAVAPP